MMKIHTSGIILLSLLFSTKIIRFSIQHLAPLQIPYYNEPRKKFSAETMKILTPPIQKPFVYNLSQGHLPVSSCL